MSYGVLEDDELLAPQYVAPEADDDPADEFEGQWHFEQGFPDARRAVRIWLDEESRRVKRIRLSPRWRERLAGRSLDEAFAEAFFLGNARLGDGSLIQEPEAPESQGDPTLTWADYGRLVARMDELVERSDELFARAPEDVRWADYRGSQSTASSANGKVTVTLSLAGLTESVHVDRAWADKARMSDITDAVLTAHEKAYAKYVPPVFVPGEHEELALELAEARADLQSIMRKAM